MIWSVSSGLVFGMAVSVASTVVLLRVLSDNNDLHTTTGHITVGWSVVQDLLTVLVLVLMPVLFGAQASSLETIGLAVLMYASDNNGILPPAGSWWPLSLNLLWCHNVR